MSLPKPHKNIVLLRAALPGCLACLLVVNLPAQQADPDLLQRHFQEGQRALAEGRYAEAANSFEKLTTLSPGIAEPHAALGVTYFQQGKFSEAVRELQTALKLKPNLPGVDLFLAMSLSEVGRHEEALPVLEKGFRKSSDKAMKRSAGLRLQRTYTALQRDREAVAVALELSRLYPEDAEILYHTGRVYANFAYLTMQKLSDTAPDSVWVHLAAGDTFESQGQHDFAVSEYHKVLDLDPGRPGVHFRLGRAILALPQQANAKDKALEEFEKELEIDPTNANAAYEAGEIHRKSGRLEPARDLFELALKHYPNFEEARVAMGKALISLGKPELALSHLQRAIELNPEGEVAYYRLAQVHRALGNSAEQKEAFAKFQYLRRRSREQDFRKQIFSPREVTQQKLDSEPAE